MSSRTMNLEKKREMAQEMLDKRTPVYTWMDYLEIPIPNDLAWFGMSSYISARMLHDFFHKTFAGKVMGLFFPWMKKSSRSVYEGMKHAQLQWKICGCMENIRRYLESIGEEE